MPRFLSQRLYLRIWLTVVSVVAILALLAGWLWRMDMARERAERPGREIVVRNAQGEVLGQAPARPMRVPGAGGGGGALEFQVALRDGQTLTVQLPRPHRPPGAASPWWRMGGMGFAELMLLLSVGVALGTYPVVRWLTQRLEGLQRGVERWGEGDLSARVPVEGHDEVAFLAQRFNVAAERMQALWHSHQVLMAHASHELRSPLARIRLGLELLDHPDPAKRAAQRAEVARNISELDQLVDEILLASRLDAGTAPPLQREPVDLTGLAAEECARTGAELQVNAQPVAMADARLLRRVLRNLLENAIRHGASAVAPVPAEGRGLGVQLTVDQVSRNGTDFAQLTVDDQGPGVPAALRTKVFEPFYRLPGASERDGGVGLGLALVRSIVQQHGGTVACTERPGGGGRFVVCLPIQPPIS
ncbi:MAG: ATP-binding protein [Burkholderiaceae bacterium]|nr:ATP-binding protein [Burkholderiaceae bacterium]